MKAHIVPNTPRDNIRCIVLNRETQKLRPVYKKQNGKSYQICKKGDVIWVSELGLRGYECFLFDEKEIPKTHGRPDFDSKINGYMEWRIESNILPNHENWNGKDTIQQMLDELKFDLLFHSVNIENCLGDLIELKYPCNKVQYVPFETDDVFVWKRSPTCKGEPAKAKKVRKLFEPCGEVVLRHVESNVGILGCQPSKPALGVGDLDCDWRSATAMPNVIQLGMVINKWGVPTRFNEIFLFSKGRLCNSISLLPIATGFKHAPNRFISLPVEIEKHIDRVIYVVHGHDLKVPEKDAIKWWLFKR